MAQGIISLIRSALKIPWFRRGLEEIALNVVANLISDSMESESANLIKRVGPVLVGLAVLLIAVALSYLGAKLVVVILRSPDGKLVLAPSIMGPIVAAIFVVILTGVAVAYSVIQPPLKPPATIMPFTIETPTLGPTGTPWPRCVYRYSEWPCKDVVQNSVPRDSLYKMAERNYHVKGALTPLYARVICEANESFLRNQFTANIPSAEERQKVWDGDHCNYVVPGNELIIPIPPVLPPPPK